MNIAFQLRWLDRFFLIRVATVLMILAIVAARDISCTNPVVYHPILFLFGGLYPHLVQLLLGRFEGRRFRGRYSLLVDGFFAGAAMPILAFSAIPCVVLATINLFNWMALGGTSLAVLGGLASLAGLGLSGLFVGFGLSNAACPSADFLSYGALLAYFALVAWMVFRYSTAMQRHCDDLQVKADVAEMSWRRAERALLAVLPNSVALEHENGGIAERKIADATLFLADFSLPLDSGDDIAKLQAVFRACDGILSRHGLEAVKTSGRRYLAWTEKEAGPENALVAALEVVAYLRDHEMVPNPNAQGNESAIRLAIHCGPVVAGLVQSEKFGYDVLGTTVDELASLIEEGGAAIRISAAARVRLRSEWRLAALQGSGLLPAFTPVEHRQV